MFCLKKQRLARYTRICRLVAKEAESYGWVVGWEPVYRASPAKLIPDLVFRRPGEAFIIDVTLRYEQEKALRNTAHEKERKYRPLVPLLARELGITVRVFGLPVDASGAWSRVSEGVLAALWIKDKAFMRILSRAAMLCTFNMPRDGTRGRICRRRRSTVS